LLSVIHKKGNTDLIGAVSGKPGEHTNLASVNFASERVDAERDSAITENESRFIERLSSVVEVKSVIVEAESVSFPVGNVTLANQNDGVENDFRTFAECDGSSEIRYSFVEEGIRTLVDGADCCAEQNEKAGD
jgi:hypothetical protein